VYNKILFIDKGNHYRVGGFIYDKNSLYKFIYININFDFLGLENVYFKITFRQWTRHMGRFLIHLKHSQSVLFQI
jgi:hypothetical protein